MPDIDSLMVGLFRSPGQGAGGVMSTGKCKTENMPTDMDILKLFHIYFGHAGE